MPRDLMVGTRCNSPQQCTSIMCPGHSMCATIVGRHLHCGFEGWMVGTQRKELSAGLALSRFEQPRRRNAPNREEIRSRRAVGIYSRNLFLELGSSQEFLRLSSRRPRASSVDTLRDGVSLLVSPRTIALGVKKFLITDQRVTATDVHRG